MYDFFVNDSSACMQCAFCKIEKETMEEPESIYCEEDQENFGTEGGCWLWEDARRYQDEW